MRGGGGEYALIMALLLVPSKKRFIKKTGPGRGERLGGYKPSPVKSHCCYPAENNVGKNHTKH